MDVLEEKGCSNFDISSLLSDAADSCLEASFLKTLFDSMPCGILVIDQKREIRMINKMLERILGVQRKVVLGKHSGQILGCIYAHQKCEEHSNRDSSPVCTGCEAGKVALAALSGNRQQKIQVPFQLSINGKVHDLELLMSAVPFDFQREHFAVLIFEDIFKLHHLRVPQMETSFRGMIGHNGKMLELFHIIRKVGCFDFPVLIQGETGTGKELVAMAIHKESRRASRYFVPVNCAALPLGLLENELFGHVKGAFTGATRDKRGRFHVADGGTLFLDEIGDMHLDLQAKLLRVIESGSFEPLGSSKAVKVDVRVISATNKNLEEEVAAGRFRMDLYHRVATLPINLPPLRERPMDIGLLADFFLQRAMGEMRLSGISFSDETLEKMNNYFWPGNVRELQNAVHFALVKCSGKIIQPQHLPSALLDRIKQFTLYRRKLDMKAVQVLLDTTRNVAETAQKLGVSRATLYRFLKKHTAS